MYGGGQSNGNLTILVPCPPTNGIYAFSNQNGRPVSTDPPNFQYDMRPAGGRGSNKGGGTSRHKLLEAALRALNALCIEHRQPDQADEAHLREAAGDKTTPL